MDNKVDFFQKKLSNPRSFSRKKKTSKIWVSVLVVFVLLVLGFLIWEVLSGNDNIVDNNEWEEIQDRKLSLWEKVYLQWDIKADGNIMIHPYIIDDINYGKIWLRANSWINLSDYVGFVELTGIVEKFYQSNPIVKVYSISWTKVGSGDEVNMVFEGDNGYYISEAWILFLPGFYDEYLSLNDGKDWNILIKKLDSWDEITINYFRCNASDPNRNCKGLGETFANNNAQSFVTSEWDVFYKLSETQSWFVSNGNWWWIFINDVSDDVIFELKDLIKFANEKNVNEWIKSRAASICQWSWEKLQKINNSEINLKQEWLIVTVSGDGVEKQMTCQIFVDFGLPAKWKLQSLTIGDDVVASNETEESDSDDAVQNDGENTEDWQISAIALDTNVPQFPIKEEWLQYKSTRWKYVLKFPSSNISYSVSSVKENFGRNDVDCSYVINVIKYSEKENLEVSPAIRIFECQWSVEKSWDQWIVVYPRLDKKFIVQMNDGAWNNFSMSLKFEELAEE